MSDTDRLCRLLGDLHDQLGLGKRKDARALFIETRPANDAHFFARLLDEDDESIFSLIYAAAVDDNPFAVKTWRKANPALPNGMPALDVLRAEARLAKRDVAELTTFKALRLNMGTSETEQRFLLDASIWKELETDMLPPRDGPMALGIDLGFTAAFCAAAAFWPRTGRLEGFVACGNQPLLRDRALADGVPGEYEAMYQADELVLLGQRVVPVAPFLAEVVRRYGRPDAIAADRWRADELADGAGGLWLSTFPVYGQRRGVATRIAKTLAPDDRATACAGAGEGVDGETRNGGQVTLRHLRAGHGEQGLCR